MDIWRAVRKGWDRDGRRHPLAVFVLATAATGASSLVLAESAAELRAVRWALTRSDLVAPPPPFDARLTFEFSRVELTIRGGCWRVQSRYRLTGVTLVIDRWRSFDPCRSGGASDTAEAVPYEPALRAFLEARPTLQGSADDLTLATAEHQLTFKAEPRPGAAARAIVIQVAPERRACTGMVPMQCLQIRAAPGAPWRLFYEDIQDFAPEPGVAYRLRVREEVLTNPPADASDVRTYLDAVLARDRLIGR